MDSRQRFVLIYSSVVMMPFVVLTFLNSNDLGLYVSTFAISYFALRLVFNPKIRTKIDFLGLVLFCFFLFYVAERVLSILRG